MKIYAIVGQTLSGKTTLVKDLVTSTGIKQVTTYTNRPMRDGEINGKDYHFVSTEELEKPQYFGHRYFYTKYREEPFIYAMKVNDFILSQEDKIVITDPKGLRELKNKFTNMVVSVYVNASEDLIRKRAKKRGDSIDEVNRRLSVDRDLFVSAPYFADIVLDADSQDMLKYMCNEIKGE
ncbi:guanylate kinase [Staphylococcus phage PG-2021_5]|nr:guanylate kinase [Staphylococcus phage S-CoN_Ph14]WNM53933.1 guanylate kinase [Staphylococcus phage S-CoN_Ph15]WNM54107.1 guanylate kinase [Staphylococcus phage S-CoN_Ph16]